MKSPGSPANHSNFGLSPVEGFTLTDSAVLNASSLPRSVDSSPLRPSATPRTPAERRAHLIHVLECAMAILDENDHSVMPSANDPERRGAEGDGPSPQPSSN